MCQNNAKKPILIRDVDGVQTFSDPETGKEFSTTINKPMPDAGRDSCLATLKCKIRADEEIAKQVSIFRTVLGCDTTLTSQEVLAEIRSERTITVAGLRIWRAEQIAEELKSLGFSVEIERP